MAHVNAAMMYFVRCNDAPRNAVIRVVVRLERRQEALTEPVALLLGRHRARRGRRAIQIVDVQIHDAHLGRRPHAVASLGGKADDPRAWVVHVNLCVARVHRCERDPAPSSELDEVLDSVYGNAKDRWVPREEQNPARRCEGDLRRTWRISVKISICTGVDDTRARTSQMVRMLSMFKHLNSGHIVKFTSTRPRPKSSPPGKRATTSKLVSEAEPEDEAEASRRTSSPGRGAGCDRILLICRVCDWTSFEKRAHERVR